MKFTITIDSDDFVGVLKCRGVVANKKNKMLDIFADNVIHHFTYDDSGECTISEWVDTLTKKGKADGTKINLQPLVNPQCQCQNQKLAQ